MATPNYSRSTFDPDVVPGSTPDSTPDSEATPSSTLHPGGATTDQRCYQDETHAVRLLRSLNALRKDATLCDARLSVGGAQFCAHSAVLAAASPYFQAMFAGPLSVATATTGGVPADGAVDGGCDDGGGDDGGGDDGGGDDGGGDDGGGVDSGSHAKVDGDSDKASKVVESEPLVQIGGIDAETFEILLNYVYTGSLKLSESNVQDVAIAADMLSLAGVVRICSDFLREHISAENCLGVMMFATAISCPDLEAHACQFFYDNFVPVSEEVEFLSLPPALVLNALGSEELRVEREEQVLTAAMRWLLHAPASRRLHLLHIIKAVRLPLIPPTTVTSTIDAIEDLSVRVALQVLLDEYQVPRLSKSSRPTAVSTSDFSRRAKPRRKARKYLYVIGGYTRQQGGRWGDSRALSCVERMDTISLYWTLEPSLHQARSGHCVVTLDGFIYAIGGESESMIFAFVERFDPVCRQWAPVASMLSPRCSFGACVCNGAIYVMGGWVGADIGSSVERYDAAENRWVALDSMEPPRHSFGCCHMDGLIYVAGGLGVGSSELSSTASFDPRRQRWTWLPALQRARSHVALCALGGRIYALGGWDDALGALDSVEVYSPDEECWQEAPPMPCARAGCAAVAVGGRLYVTGGRIAPPGGGLFSSMALPGAEGSLWGTAPPVTLDSTEMFDPTSGTWQTLGRLVTSRTEAGLAAI
ncbi:actin-binding protein IPP [Lampetra fluviatilis]